MTIIEQKTCEAIISMAKKDEPDYWEKLKHQYAGMAMQGMISNPIGFENIRARTNGDLVEDVVTMAVEYANAFIEKFKEENNEKSNN